LECSGSKVARDFAVEADAVVAFEAGGCAEETLALDFSFVAEEIRN